MSGGTPYESAAPGPEVHVLDPIYGSRRTLCGLPLEMDKPYVRWGRAEESDCDGCRDEAKRR